MAGYFTSATAYAEIADNSALDLDSTNGWTFSFFVYPVSADTQTAFGYIYSHAQPFNFAPAVNILRIGSAGIDYGKIRLILDWAGGNLVDRTSSLTVTDDQWNHVMVTYDGTNCTIAVDGSTDTFTPAALPNIQPSSVARIGNSTASPIGTRWFPGRIAEAAQWDREFSSSDITAFSGIFLSPEFAQNSLSWHSEMFTSAAYDRQGVVSISPSGGMQWAAHGPFIYPAKSFKGQGAGPPPVTSVQQFVYYRSA